MFQLNKTLVSLAFFAITFSQSWAAWTPCTGEYAGWCKWGDACHAINRGANDTDVCSTVYENCAEHSTVFSDAACTEYKAGNNPTYVSPGCCNWGTGCWKIKSETEAASCNNIIPTCLDFEVGDEAGTCPAGSETSSSSGGLLVGTSSSSNFTPESKGYYIFENRGKTAANFKTLFNEYVLAFTYGGATISNGENIYGPIIFEEGVAKLKGANINPTPPPYSGAFLGIKNQSDFPNLSLCKGGLSYWYKGDPHWFLLEFEKSVCSETADDVNNKWGMQITAASPNSWTKQTIDLVGLGLADSWSGAECTASNALPVDLTKVEQITWGFDEKINGSRTNLMIADVICYTLDNSNPVTTTAPDNSITIAAPVLASSSSVTIVIPSSSSAEVITPSSSSLVAVIPSSSSTGGITPSSSSSGGANSFAFCKVADYCHMGPYSFEQCLQLNGVASNECTASLRMISRIAKANAVQLIKNGVSLQVTQNATLEVFDLSGKRIRKLNFSNGVWSVQLSDMPKGLYIVKISFGSSREILRVPVK